MQIEFDHREKSYISETKEYTERIIILHDLLSKAQERLEQGWDPLRSVSEAFREQVETLQMQLDTKDQLNEKLKADVIKA